MWAKTLAGTERSDIPRYLVQSDFEPFPFQSGRIMASFQSVGMTQYFQMSVKRGSRQLMTGAPPEVALPLYRRFRELCFSSVFGLQPISRLPLVG